MRTKKSTFKVGDRVRYKPGIGTYGYEETIHANADGRVPGRVVAFTTTRIRVELAVIRGGEPGALVRAVDAASLKLEPGQSIPAGTNSQAGTTSPSKIR